VLKIYKYLKMITAKIDCFYLFYINTRLKKKFAAFLVNNLQNIFIRNTVWP